MAGLVLFGAGVPIASVAEADLGARVYADICANCHGETATQGASGDIRGLPEEVVARAVRGYDQMPDLDLDAAEAEAVAAYILSLGAAP